MLWSKSNKSNVTSEEMIMGEKNQNNFPVAQ